jgi:hypothetical protein
LGSRFRGNDGRLFDHTKFFSGHILRLPDGASHEFSFGPDGLRSIMAARWDVISEHLTRAMYFSYFVTELQ